MEELEWKNGRMWIIFLLFTDDMIVYLKESEGKLLKV